jgi:hypothetical protein
VREQIAMTERQAMKLSGLQDELRKRAMDMGFTAEQVEMHETLQ